MGSSFLEKFVSTAPAVAKLFVGDKLGFYATDLTKFLMVYEGNQKAIREFKTDR